MVLIASFSKRDVSGKLLSLPFLKLQATSTLWIQFKEISFAYEVLTNPEKKELYDRYGEQGLREGGGGGGGMDDIFSHIFGGGLFGFMGGQGRRNGGRRRGEDMVHPLKWVDRKKWIYAVLILTLWLP